MLVIIGSVLLFIGLIFGLIIIINAFKESAGQGLLCMFVPFYIFYFAFARYSGSKKGLVVGSWLGTYAIGTALVVIGTVVAANDVAVALEQDLQNMPEMGQAPTGDTAAPAGDTEGGAVVSCDLSQQAGRICNEYTLSGTYTRDNAAQHCDMMQVLVDDADKETLADGSCPTDNAIAKCEPRFGNNTTVYYRDTDPNIDNDAAMNAAENLCTGTFSRL